MIKIDDNYSLEADSNNWILRYEEEIEKEIKGESKKVLSKDEWYHPSIKSALNKYLNQVTKPSENFFSLMESVEKAESTILKLKIK